jgi:hypothetical protein
MNLFYLISLLWLFPALPVNNGEARRNDLKWVIQKTSNLNIAGHTNVNSFACVVNQYTRPDTITCISGNDQRSTGITLKGSLLIDVNAFDCSNRPMTSELKKTLKQPQYPYLKITFLSLEKMPCQQARNESMKGYVNIEMAGVCKTFEINYELFTKSDACKELIGCRTFCFSDFGLEPPKKMGGIIRVKNEINVQFHLYIQQIKS